MSKYQKQVNGLFFGAGIIVWLLSKHYLEVAMVAWGLSRKLGGAAEVLHILLPILFAVGTFVALRTNNTSHNFVSDAVSELALVSWPSKKETQVGTIVVIVTVIVAGIFLGIVDLSFMAIVKTVINL